MKSTPVKVSRYELTAAHAKIVAEKLQGGIGFREMARQIGCSPQQAVNLTAGIAVQWVVEGKLVFTNKAVHAEN